MKELPRRGPLPLTALRVAVLPCWLALLNCTPPAGSALTVTEAAPLESWQGRTRELLDDSIDPAAVGPANPALAAQTPILVERANHAEFVLRTRIKTVTADGSGAQAHYQITLSVVGDPLIGPRPPTDTLTLNITPASPSFGVAKALDLRLSGKTVVALVRRFQQGEQQILHWHLTTDSPEVHRFLQRVQVMSDASH